MIHSDVAYEIHGLCPWGGMGDILIHGFLWNEHSPDVYELVRTGPFVSPISFPSGYCAITDAVKDDLQAAGFSGFELSELPLGKVVESDWHLWDRTQDLDYSKLPPDDEIYSPEDLILVPEHRPELAEGMPKFWLLKGVEVHFEWETYTDDLQTLSWTRSELNGWDFCSPSGALLFLSKRARDWFQDRYGEWLEFREFPIVE
jgi:hypothetical protein